MNSKDIHLPEVTCPQCNAVLNAATSLDRPKARPSPGDLSICGDCGAMLTFKADLTLQPMPPALFNALPEAQRQLL